MATGSKDVYKRQFQHYPDTFQRLLFLFRTMPICIRRAACPLRRPGSGFRLLPALRFPAPALQLPVSLLPAVYAALRGLPPPPGAVLPVLPVLSVPLSVSRALPGGHEMCIRDSPVTVRVLQTSPVLFSVPIFLSSCSFLRFILSSLDTAIIARQAVSSR